MQIDFDQIAVETMPEVEPSKEVSPESENKSDEQKTMINDKL
jgi:hypothetical protein